MSNLNLKEIRSQEQKEHYQSIQEACVCPFCRENFDKYKQNEILQENDSWLVTENGFPYEGTKYHFLFVYKKNHITSPDEMDSVDYENLFKLVNWVNKKYEIDSGSFLMRYGGEGNGSSVHHLHAHIIVGSSSKPTENKIRVKVGYGK